MHKFKKNKAMPSKKVTGKDNNIRLIFTDILQNSKHICLGVQGYLVNL